MSLVFEAHRLLYHSTLGLKVIKKKKNCPDKEEGRGLIPQTYLRLIDFVYHSTLGLRVIKKKKF